MNLAILPTVVVPSLIMQHHHSRSVGKRGSKEVFLRAMWERLASQAAPRVLPVDPIFG
jgi:hypothetical protein